MLGPAVRHLTPAALQTMPLPAPGTDKEDRGRLCVVGGSVQVPGAALLAAEAALRAGAGKLQIATVRSCATALGVAVPEALVIGLPEDASGEIAPGSPALQQALEQCDAVLIGPGMSATPFLTRLTARLHQMEATVVLDAGALNSGVSAGTGAPFILTPACGRNGVHVRWAEGGCGTRATRTCPADGTSHGQRGGAKRATDIHRGSQRGGVAARRRWTGPRHFRLR